MIKHILMMVITSTMYYGCQIGNESSSESKEIKMPIVETIVFEDIPFLVCKIDPKSFELKMASNQMDGISKILELGDSLFSDKRQLLFATNGGIFSEGYIPGGLFIQNGIVHRKLNKREGAGNFHLMPNGVFCLGKNNIPFVVESKQFDETKNDAISLGIQSGPMLLIDNNIHPAFREGSSNTHIRNGVGVDNEGNIVFVISKKRTNFYTFGSLFKEQLNCKNALYLDGFISEMYVKGLSKENEFNRKFATILYLDTKL